MLPMPGARELEDRVLAGVAREKGLSAIADGSNADDVVGHRPGARAAAAFRALGFEEVTLDLRGFIEAAACSTRTNRCGNG
jgi:PP-loop superfamily ATP-utilizing enzyme